MFQVTQKDVEGRLRLMRYGVIVITITAFLVSFLTQWRILAGFPAAPGMMSYLMNALITTVIVAVIMAVVYFAYAYFLKRTVKPEEKTASE